MKKRILCLTLALIISGAQVVSVSATREDEAALQQEMDATNEQLNATYSRLDELSSQKSQIEGEISTLDANLVNVMVSIQTLEGDISNKEADIASTQTNLEKAKNAKQKQYEAMKKRIQYLYEKGGDDAWFPEGAETVGRHAVPPGRIEQIGYSVVEGTPWEQASLDLSLEPGVSRTSEYFLYDLKGRTSTLRVRVSVLTEGIPVDCSTAGAHELACRPVGVPDWFPVEIPPTPFPSMWFRPTPLGLRTPT